MTPTAELTLRLSSHLLLGIVHIHSKQTHYALRESKAPHSDPDPDPDWLRLHGGKLDSNPDSDHLSHVDCDPDSNPDSGPGARVNAA